MKCIKTVYNKILISANIWCKKKNKTRKSLHTIEMLQKQTSKVQKLANEGHSLIKHLDTELPCWTQKTLNDPAGELPKKPAVYQRHPITTAIISHIWIRRCYWSDQSCPGSIGLCSHLPASWQLSWTGRWHSLVCSQGRRLIKQMLVNKQVTDEMNLHLKIKKTIVS